MNTVTTQNKPKTAYFLKSKVARVLSSKAEIIGFDDPISVKTLKGSSKMGVELMLYEISPSGSLVPDINRLDMAILDSAITLMLAGRSRFTAQTVVRTLRGNFDSHRNVTAQQVKLVTDSVNKLSRIGIRIDCSEEYAVRKLCRKGDQVIFEGPILPVRKAEVRAGNGLILPGWILESDPVLYAEAHTLHQIAKVPMELLQLNPGESLTVQYIMIRRYLFDRIEGMKSRRNSLVSRKISYEWYDSRTRTMKGLLEELGYTKDAFRNWPNTKARIHKIITGILDDFCLCGYIKSYQLEKQGNRITGYLIYP